MTQHLVVEALQRVCCALLLLPVAVEFEDHQFAQRVMQIAGIVSAAHRFLPNGLFSVVAVVLEEIRVVDVTVVR